MLKKRVLQLPGGVLLAVRPGQVQVVLIIVKYLHLLGLYMVSESWFVSTFPVFVSYLNSLSPGLLAPVSGARVEFIGLTPGARRAQPTGVVPSPERNTFTFNQGKYFYENIYTLKLSV